MIRMVFEMKNQKQTACILSGLLLASCLAGCGTISARAGSTPSQDTALSLSSQESGQMPCAQYTGHALEDTSDSMAETGLQERFRLYEPFGMTYDADENALWYHGKRVRWFEDYYPLDEETGAGIDFFDEHGTTDVYAVRDLQNPIRHLDGSFDPGGRITGLKECSEQEFKARDIAAIKNPPVKTATAAEDGTLTEQEKQKIAGEYAAFGVTGDAETGIWYFHGQKVRFFLDILTSNGEPADSGNFHGSIRQWQNDDGEIDIYTVRDFQKQNDEKNGTLKSIQAYSQQEFDARTQKEKDCMAPAAQTQETAYD